MFVHLVSTVFYGIDLFRHFIVSLHINAQIGTDMVNTLVCFIETYGWHGSRKHLLPHNRTVISHTGASEDISIITTNLS